MKCLPLKEDQEENMTVYKCIAHLYSQGNAQVGTNNGDSETVLWPLVSYNSHS